MIGGSVAYYPFPDDDNQTLHRMISKLPVENRRAMVWRPTENWLLEVSPGVARDLKERFSGMGLYQPDPVGMPDRVLVPSDLRSSVLDVLTAANSLGTWFQIEGVEFRDQAAKRAFEALL